VSAGTIKGKEAVLVQEVWRDYSRAVKIPDSFVRERATLLTKAHAMWEEARHTRTASIFLPYLEKIVALKRREAKLLGYKDHPYDALLDEYEPGMSTKEAEKILGELKTFLVPFLKKIQKKGNKKSPSVQGTFPLHEQIAFNKMIAKKIGFDFEMGRLDASTHPFTTTFHANDVRITTRYKESDVLYALGSTIHETGHALYEQGLLAEHFGTPLGDYISLGIHESQSRMWERIIGTSEDFWKYFYPQLQKTFPKPYKTIAFEDFYRHLNRVEASYIRTEADEVALEMKKEITYFRND
jgi:carboxypeptidase Taq